MAFFAKKRTKVHSLRHSSHVPVAVNIPKGTTALSATSLVPLKLKVKIQTYEGIFHDYAKLNFSPSSTHKFSMLAFIPNLSTTWDMCVIL
eukprot:14282109-Ditylum_brightwellii.AAC.1